MIILGTNSVKAAGGFNVDNSCMFNSADSPYLDRSQGTATGATKYTLSMWIKRSKLGAEMNLIGVSSGNTIELMKFKADNKLAWYNRDASSNAAENTTANIFRDVSAWYHFVFVYDSTQSGAANQRKFYINGVNQTWGSANAVQSNAVPGLNLSGANIKVGAEYSPNYYYGGYMSEVNFIDGQALAADSFGEFDEDSPTIWKPKDASGLTFGNNGFYLDFKDSANLGNDATGGTDFSENNIVATDQGIDTCTNNFSTMNPLNVPASNAPTFASGNSYSQSVTGGTSGSAFSGSSTIGMTLGKWYIEAKAVTTGQSRSGIGISGESSKLARDNNSGTSGSNSSYLYSSEAGIVYSNTGSVSGYASYTNNDIIGIAVDLTNSKVYFSKNGVFGNSSNPSTGSNGISITALSSTTDGVYFIIGGSTAGGGASSAYSAMNHNFGSPYYAISSGNADGNGFGNFEYAPPSGFLALCTKNLGSDGG